MHTTPLPIIQKMYRSLAKQTSKLNTWMTFKLLLSKMPKCDWLVDSSTNTQSKKTTPLLLVSEILAIHVEDGILESDGWLNLQQAGSVTINGLDGYAKPELIERFPYAKPTR